ncbi:hypothetical protein BV22DRAFT_1036430 [Leucogyrophana mollusca]|uniref:Uncharacterized protein n=1 Tax=Leucogyrophana mollusca TaxID=85980 RepID=A0ACB8BDC3_9AGAM|nr:hypothetical protein BV22DRAFT_1036430 [Leucogyrophana mollusca]
MPSDLLEHKIFSIDGTPPSDSAVENYSKLRLLSLKVDPASFGSTYEREVAFSKDIWFKRLSSPFKQTFISSVRDDDGNDRWVGTVTILAPSELLPSTVEPFQRAGAAEDWDLYFLVAMWVHPEYRGKGLGKELVAAGLEWARNNRDPKDDPQGNREKVIALLVRDHNIGGRALYEKMKFEYLVGVASDDEKDLWMTVKCS